MGKEETQVMKRMTRMLILIAVLAAVAIGYSLISRLSSGQDNAGASNKEISVASHDSNAVERLEWEYKGERIRLVKENNRWKYAEDGAFPLDLSKVQTMLSAISDIKASRSIDQAGSLSEYGLEEPQCIITVTSGGTEYTYFIGSKNEVTGEYYLYTGQGDKVYMVNSGLYTAYSKTLLDMVVRQSIPDLTTAKEISIETPEGLKKIVYKDKHEGITYTNAYKWFYEFAVEGNTVYSPVGSDKVRNLQRDISGIKWVSCVDYFATGDELADYGLDSPRAVVSVKFSNGDFKLMFGDYVDDNCYAMAGDSGIVYTVSASDVDDLLKVDFDSLRPDDVCLMEWETVDSMEVEVDGETLMIYFERGNSVDGESGSGVKEVSYIIDGRQGDSTAVKKFLDAITGLTSDGETDKPAPFKDPEVKIVFNRNTEFFHTMTLSLYRFNSQSYLVEFDGQARLLVGNDDVFELKEAFAVLSE